MDSHNQLDDWQPCPTGELSRMAARLDSLQGAARFHQLVSTGLLSMIVCAVAAVLLGGYVFYAEPSYGGISCLECQAHAAEFHDYLVGKNATMDPQMAKEVKKHLKKCNGCRAKFRKSFPEAPVGPLATCQPCLHHCSPELSECSPPAEF